jgi:hypothetical protein
VVEQVAEHSSSRLHRVGNIEDRSVQLGGGEVALGGGGRCEQVDVRARAAGRAAVPGAGDGDGGVRGVRVHRFRGRIDRDRDRAIAAGLVRTDLGSLMEEEGHAERVDRAHRPVRPPVLGEHAVTRGRGGEGVRDDDLCVGTELHEVALDEF